MMIFIWAKSVPLAHTQGSLQSCEACFRRRQDDPDNADMDSTHTVHAIRTHYKAVNECR